MAQATTYRLVYSARAEEHLEALREQAPIARQRIQVLEHDPWKGRVLRAPLSDLRSLHFFLVGKGQFRALYSVDRVAATCTIEYVRSREECYRTLWRSKYRG